MCVCVWGQEQQDYWYKQHLQNLQKLKNEKAKQGSTDTSSIGNTCTPAPPPPNEAPPPPPPKEEPPPPPPPDDKVIIIRNRLHYIKSLLHTADHRVCVSAHHGGVCRPSGGSTVTAVAGGSGSVAAGAVPQSGIPVPGPNAGTHTAPADTAPVPTGHPATCTHTGIHTYIHTCIMYLLVHHDNADLPAVVQFDFEYPAMRFLHY